ncbi:DNA polymerase III subunit gamma/tau [Atopobium fossor]|uniref:DNA polymerase III subunit gamma/tau n=1 Tax=Atopobium fossor TaxID=39487 RepID=UPI0003FCC715|nr:DNA polymerase III subunit gamma/tau [Atopobium fossor]
MESLYTKYRPQTFDDVVGQSHVVSTLKRAVVEGRTGHAYLFCGPRGTGKTTMARVLAKALICKKGKDGLPDGTCEDCQLIAAGEHPDVYELDAASRTGVDSVRDEIINNVNFAPVRGQCKVYIIDEVHMLTNQAFNALLKTLEEPPSHVVFILCTTDPQKILATVLSRVQRFDFHAISLDDITNRLAYICNAESFNYDESALELVARHARGGLRDALSTLEQLSVFGAGTISIAGANDMLGSMSNQQLGQVTAALATRDVTALFNIVAELVNNGHDLLQFTRELAAHIRDLYVIAAGGNPATLVLGTHEEITQLTEEAQQFLGGVDRLSRVLVELGHASSQMRMATNQRLVLEVCFTRLARPESDLTLEALAERIAVLESQLTQGFSPALASVPTSAPASEPADPTATPVPAPMSVPEPVVIPANKPVESAPEPFVSQPSVAESTPESKPDITPSAPGSPELMRGWRQVLDNLHQKAPSRSSLLMNAILTADSGKVLTVSLPAGSRFAMNMLVRPEVMKEVQAAVQSVFGQRGIDYVESSTPTTQVSAPSLAPQPVAMPVSASVPEPAPKLEPSPVPMPAEEIDFVSAPVPVPEPASDSQVPVDVYGDIEPAPWEDTAAPTPTPTSTQSPKPAAKATPKRTKVGKTADSYFSARIAIPNEVPDDLTALLEDVFGGPVTVTTIASEVEDEADAYDVLAEDTITTDNATVEDVSGDDFVNYDDEENDES